MPTGYYTDKEIDKKFLQDSDEAVAALLAKSRGKVEGGIRWVTIQGLKSEDFTKLNGKVGKILSSEKRKDGRVKIKVDGTKGIALLKEENLMDIPDSDLFRVCRKACDGEGGELEVLIFPKQHSIFQNQKQPAGNCPVMALCGFPLMIQNQLSDHLKI